MWSRARVEAAATLPPRLLPSALLACLQIRLSMEQPCKTLAYATFDETQKAFPSTHGGLPHVVAVDGRLSSALTEWRLRDAIGARASLSSPSASRSSTQYSHLTVMIPVKRHSSFVVWNFIVRE